MCTFREFFYIRTGGDDAISKSLGGLSLSGTPPHELTKYHANPIRSGKCSVYSTTEIVLVSRENQRPVWAGKWFTGMYLYLRHVVTTDRTDRWGHGSVAPYGGRRVTPAVVVWSPAGCPGGVGLHRVSAWQLSPQLTSTTSTRAEFYGPATEQKKST